MPTEQAQIPPTHTETITYNGREFAATEDAYHQIDRADAHLRDRLEDDPADYHICRVDEAADALRETIRRLAAQGALIYTGRAQHTSLTFNGHLTSPSEKQERAEENERRDEQIDRDEREALQFNNGETVEWSSEFAVDESAHRTEMRMSVDGIAYVVTPEIARSIDQNGSVRAAADFSDDRSVRQREHERADAFERELLNGAVANGTAQIIQRVQHSERNPTEIRSMGSSGPLMEQANRPDPVEPWQSRFSADDQAKFKADPAMAAHMKASVESYDAAMNTPPSLRYRLTEFSERFRDYLSLAFSETAQAKPLREEWREFKAHIKAMAQPLQPSWVPAHADPRKQLVRESTAALSPERQASLTRTFKIRNGRGFDYYLATPEGDRATNVRGSWTLHHAVKQALKNGTVVKSTESEFLRVKDLEAAHYVPVQKQLTDVRHVDFGKWQQPAQSAVPEQAKATAQMYTLNGPNGSHMSANKEARDVFYALNRAAWVSPEVREMLVRDAMQAGAMKHGATHSVMPDVPDRFKQQKAQKELRNQQSITH